MKLLPEGSSFRQLTIPGGDWGGSPPFLINSGGVYVRIAFSQRKRWRFRLKMITALSGNSCLWARISALLTLVEKTEFFND
jgi:hypothetical protein